MKKRTVAITAIALVALVMVAKYTGCFDRQDELVVQQAQEQKRRELEQLDRMTPEQKAELNRSLIRNGRNPETMTPEQQATYLPLFGMMAPSK
jgi:hypothetical protein